MTCGIFFFDIRNTTWINRGVVASRKWQLDSCAKSWKTVHSQPPRPSFYSLERGQQKDLAEGGATVHGLSKQQVKLQRRRAVDQGVPF